MDLIIIPNVAKILNKNKLLGLILKTVYPLKLDFVDICYNLPLLFQTDKAENIYF